MKRVFEFYADEERYIIKNTNPDDVREAFSIVKTDMEFDSARFYEYVFADINYPIELEIVNKVEDVADRAAVRVYTTINDICQGVIQQLNEEVLI